MTDDGRALSRAKGSGFVAQNWLENDGDAVDQPKAAERWAHVPDQTVGVLKGKTAMAGFSGCTRGQIWVANTRFAEGTVLDCMVFSPKELQETGAVALYRDGEKYRVKTARGMVGARIWNAPQLRD